MKRIFMYILLFSCCVANTWGQQEKSNRVQEKDVFAESFRGNKQSRATAGSCQYVMKLLRVALENDSLAVATFKREYEITNMPLYAIKALWKKDDDSMIRFFEKKENRHYFCRSKIFRRNDYVLLID